MSRYSVESRYRSIFTKVQMQVLEYTSRLVETDHLTVSDVINHATYFTGVKPTARQIRYLVDSMLVAPRRDDRGYYLFGLRELQDILLINTLKVHHKMSLLRISGLLLVSRREQDVETYLGKGSDEYASCFLSYSGLDTDFAYELVSQLRNKGVRCWFAPEDMKIGDHIRLRIDESIRQHDKLLLVLSGSSVASPWVEREVLAAMEREDRQGKEVLFPIRLDDAVMETDQAWAAEIRRTRHIGDFTQWKDVDSYRAAFERLLRDLKS